MTMMTRAFSFYRTASCASISDNEHARGNSGPQFLAALLR
jgi:hypothetical protein